jgi:hypothetical protein
MFETRDPVGVQERYESASNSPTLVHSDNERGAVDTLRDAASVALGSDGKPLPPWSAGRIGMALLRLHSEWSGLAKPHRPSKEQMKGIAASMPDEKGRPDMARAVIEADRWFSNELRLLANGLKSRAVVWNQLALWIAQKGISPEVAAEGLLYWLNPTCPKCDGHGVRKVPDQPALSAKRCSGQGSCWGTGKRPHPEGSGKLLGHLDYCVGVARGSLKKRLRPQE